ncbi:MAG: DUF1700 domain-containing protein [Firmicutes bacterium]|nr:DUF1700 domain-containing protein [Bacillota bacterium]
MDKKEFLEKLKLELIKLGEKDYKPFLSNYDELIEDYLEEGLSYQEIFEKIGTPLEVATRLVSVENSKEEFHYSKQSKGMKMGILLLLILGSPLWASLLAAAILLILSLYIIIWCIPFILGAFSFVGLVAGLACLLLSPFCFQDGLHIFLLQFGFGMVGIGIGVLISFVTLKVSSIFLEKTKQVTEILVKPLKRKGVIIYEK